MKVKNKLLVAGLLLLGMQQAYALDSVIGHVARAGLGEWYSVPDTGVIVLDVEGEGFEDSPGDPENPDSQYLELCPSYFGPLSYIDISTATGKAMMGVITSAVATGQRVQLEYEQVTEGTTTYCEVRFVILIGS